MNFLSINSSDLLEKAGQWMGQERNYQWLDFGNGTQVLSPVALKIMSQRENSLLKVFTTDDTDIPIGIVGLTNIKSDFKTAMIWGLLGEKQYSMKGYALRATSCLLRYAFYEMKLNTVDAWAVSCNYPSLRLIRKLNFKRVGTHRNSHIMNGRIYDRYLFDLLATEYRDIDDV